MIRIYWGLLGGISLPFLFVWLIFISTVGNTSEIVITVRYEPAEMLVPALNDEGNIPFEIYPVSVNDLEPEFTLPSLVPQTRLGSRDAPVFFDLSSFGQHNTRLELTADFSQRMFDLLINDPDLYISNQDNLDSIVSGDESTHRQLGDTYLKPTCTELYIYFETGIRFQEGIRFSHLSSIPDNPEALRPGDWVALVRGDVAVHIMLHLIDGVYMSKVGQNKIYFHSLKSALTYYGNDLVLQTVSCSVLDAPASNKTNHNPPPPPPPAAGACGGASLQSAY